MDRQIRFDEEVIKKLGYLNSHFEKLEDILEEISSYDCDNEFEFLVKDASTEVKRILNIMNQILEKLDDRD